MAEKKARYSKPASQEYIERGLKTGFASSAILTTSDEYQDAESDGKDREFAVEGNDTAAFVGVSSEYANYASVGGKPFRAEGGPEAEIEDMLLGESDGNKNEFNKQVKASKTKASATSKSSK